MQELLNGSNQINDPSQYENIGGGIYVYEKERVFFSITKQCNWDKNFDENQSIESVANRARGEVCFYYGNFMDFTVFISLAILFLGIVSFIMRYMRRSV